MPEHKGKAYTLNKSGGYWFVSFYYTEDGKRKRFRKQGSTEEVVRSYAEKAIDRLQGGAAPQPPTVSQFRTPTISRIFDMVWENEWDGTRGGRTAKTNALHCIRLLGEDTPVDLITTDRIDAMVAALKDEGLEGGTIRRKLSALSRLLHFAAEKCFIPAVPVIRRRGIGRERPRNRYIRDDEEATLMKFMKEWKYNDDFFAFLIDTGLRLSEAIELEWNEVDNGWVHVPENKADYPRSVPATERVKEILARRPREPGQRRVWFDMTVNRAQWQWDRARKAMGLLPEPENEIEGDVDFVIHVCRHTFASRLAMAGVPLQTIKELGGWKTLAMVMRYAHLCPGSLPVPPAR